MREPALHHRNNRVRLKKKCYDRRLAANDRVYIHTVPIVTGHSQGPRIIQIEKKEIIEQIFNHNVSINMVEFPVKTCLLNICGRRVQSEDLCFETQDRGVLHFRRFSTTWRTASRTRQHCVVRYLVRSICFLSWRRVERSESIFSPE